MFDRRIIVLLSLALLTLLASACGTDASHPAEFPGTPSPATPLPVPTATPAPPSPTVAPTSTPPPHTPTSAPTVPSAPVAEPTATAVPPTHTPVPTSAAVPPPNPSPTPPPIPPPRPLIQRQRLRPSFLRPPPCHRHQPRHRPRRLRLRRTFRRLCPFRHSRLRYCTITTRSPSYLRMEISVVWPGSLRL